MYTSIGGYYIVVMYTSIGGYNMLIELYRGYIDCYVYINWRV